MHVPSRASPLVQAHGGELTLQMAASASFLAIVLNTFQPLFERSAAVSCQTPHAALLQERRKHWR